MLAGCALVGGTQPARAFPQLALRPGGTPFEGPTDPEVTALWWNPAAIAHLRGWHVLGNAQLLLQRGSIARAAICTTTGLPCASPDRHFPETAISDSSWSGFGGITWDFRQENLSIGFGVSMPWEQHRRFELADSAAAGSGELPTAYHLRSQDFSVRYYTVSLGVKLTQKIAIGVSVSLAQSSVTLRFDRDTVLDGDEAAVQRAGGYERPMAASRITAFGDGGTFWGGIPSPTGLGISLGGMYEPTDGLVLGASWSRMFPFYGVGGRFSSARDVDTTVVPPASMGDPCRDPDSAPMTGPVPCLGGATIIYDIPDVIHLGARWRLPRHVELSTWGRAVLYGPYHTSIDSEHALVIELSGAPVERGVAPGRIVLGRSLSPAFAGELGVRWWPIVAAERKGGIVSLRLGASIAAESPAVPSNFVNAQALDGPKIDGMVGAELRLRWFRVMAGYQVNGLVFTSLNSPSQGAFDPRAATECARSRYALESCDAALGGRALPANAGSYSLFSHRITAALGFDY